ncbi:DNA polymerase III subunit gamma/tau [Hartmannibacter diazotrophicus]|uniref:DNA polymerase III subunit gamma/tau n=1 Tax=Hartmannibacter diazotrophicus TaxID=1482074 RepID=A0A2C9D6P7_9HYPH|nr:DNA polymerase III subunit delta' [Hartmannibacter diazotrophicus]SON55923.1 DNA polymerase III subunit gamma/tau [Hartmannibacter diazotrophicus]
MAASGDLGGEADALEGIPLPREQTALFGHREAEHTLAAAYRSGRMHHAWLITGPKGIGKATLAYRMARYLLSHADPSRAPESDDLGTTFDPRVDAQVTHGAHPNLLHLMRPLSSDGKRYMTVLSVDEVRRAAMFFGNSAGGSGYRIAIVDAADDMNPNAANALLKMLEEPPPRAVFFVLCHAPGRLLPTIRSRCRRLILSSLAAEDLHAALDHLGLAVDPSNEASLEKLAEGSVRRALECLSGNGLELAAAFDDLAANLPRIDRKALHRFAEAATGRKGRDELPLVGEFARTYLTEHMRLAAEQGASAAKPYADAFGRVERILAETEGINLDRKQAVLDIVQSLADCARA